MDYETLSSLEPIMRGLQQSKLARDDLRWAKFEKYISASWFTRLWVVQEVQVADTVQILFGHTAEPLLCVLAVIQCQMTWAAAVLDAHEAPQLRRVYPRARFILEPRWDHRSSLAQLLVSANSLESTDSRDRVYALLGIGDSYSRGTRTFSVNGAPFDVDYTKSTRDVYIDWAIAAMGAHGDLELLSFIGSEERESQLSHFDREGFPSWVPDWTRRLTGGMGMTYDVWSESYGSDQDASVNEDKTTLILKGTVIGQIHSVVSLFDASGGLCKKTVRELFDQYDSISCEEIKCDKLLALTCSLTCGLTWSRACAHDAPEWMLNGLTALLRDEASMDGCLEPGGDAREYRRTIIDDMRANVVLQTENGQMGSCTSHAEVGDILVIALGSRLPLILRTWRDGHYRLVGPAYVHGWMQGEVRTQLQQNQPLLGNFRLV